MVLFQNQIAKHDIKNHERCQSIIVESEPSVHYNDQIMFQIHIPSVSMYFKIWVTEMSKNLKENH